MKNCPFCHIADNRLVAENKSANLLLSDPRLMRGHFLVTPKRHVEKPWELTWAEQKAIFEMIRQTQQFIVAKISPGCDVRQNYRPFLKQGRYKVDHVHYHVMPRDLDDDLYQKVCIHETGQFGDLSDEEASDITKSYGDFANRT